MCIVNASQAVVPAPNKAMGNVKLYKPLSDDWKETNFYITATTQMPILSVDPRT